MKTDEPLATDAILDAFESAWGDNKLPAAALAQAVDRWTEVGPILIAMLEDVAGGTSLTDRTEGILCFALYLAAQVHETAAFRPLCRIAANLDQIERMIGDGVTEDLQLILARTYDGDPAPLRALIEAPDADEFVRDAGLAALAWLTATGRIDRTETARYLRELHTTLQPQDESWVWVGWQQAAANLGLEELAPLVEEAFARGFIDPMALSLHHFHEDLLAARQAATATEVFKRGDGDDGRLNDVALHLSRWMSFRPREERLPASRPAPAVRAGGLPVRNLHRGVGRNDPCPCGSGRKFKKCCLGQAAALVDAATSRRAA